MQERWQPATIGGGPRVRVNLGVTLHVRVDAPTCQIEPPHVEAAAEAQGAGSDVGAVRPGAQAPLIEGPVLVKAVLKPDPALARPVGHSAAERPAWD